MQFFPESRDELENSMNTGNKSKVRPLGDVSVKVPLGICIQIGLLNTVTGIGCDRSLFVCSKTIIFQ